MKKLLAAVLALALSAALTVTIFAAPNASLNGSDKSETIDVNVTYQDATDSPVVYSVEVEWQEMNFKYISAGSMVWDPSTHEYQNQTTGAWESNTADIKVTNHSNTEVNVSVSYTPDGTTGVTGTITNGSFTLESADGKAVSEADSKLATLTVSGVPTDKAANNLKVGAVTVVID